MIACRVNSTRLFGKPLQKIGEYTILEHLTNQIRKSKIISEIVLAISKNPGNEVFIDFAKEHKLKFVLGDEKDVLKRLIQGARSVNADIVLRISPENPFIFWEGIDTVLRKHISRKYDFSLVVSVPLGSGFEVIKFNNYANTERGEQRFTKLKNINLHPWKGKVINGGTAYFGNIIECENALVILQSNRKSLTIPGPITRWRVYPRSMNYENHLHVILDDRIEIHSFNHDYFLIQEEKEIGIQFRPEKHKRTIRKSFFENYDDIQ